MQGISNNLQMNDTAQILKKYNSEILSLWELEVTKKVLTAEKGNSIALQNDLPHIINDIADIMERHGVTDLLVDDSKYQKIFDNSESHGKSRANTSNYTVDQVVHEYIIFHRTVTDFLKSKDAYDVNVSDLLKYAVETSILKSVGSFSRSIQERQEKLVGVLAHDMRNPLAAAQLSLQMIKKDKSGKWGERMREAAERSVRKAISLVEELMNGITVKAGEGMMFNFEEKNISKDIKWAFEDAKEIYANKILFTGPDHAIIGVFDASAVRRLLENLIGNAVKYGSSLHPINIRVQDATDKITLSVHNQGEPISPEKQLHIFDFLGREKDNDHQSHSWGMGLTLVQIVAQAHGGSVELESDTQHGTTFTITLFKKFNTPGKKRAKPAIPAMD
jgi:signal transduction histidine kinase